MRWAGILSTGLWALSWITGLVGVAGAAELKPGEAAPEFTLQGSDGKKYSLEDFRGKQVVVLAWFPKAFTPGCTLECKSFGAHDAPLKAYDVAYFTISVDDAETNHKFAQSLSVDFPILSDPQGKVARAYGVAGDRQKFARRWTFYIGTDGKILAIDKNVRVATHAADVASQLEKLGVAKRK
jgi:thioredoxin-dependent peroxiredoxin